MNFLKKEFSAAIFDMDGTMFDTERLRFKTLKKASKELFGEEISDKLLFDCLGVSAVTAEKLSKDIYGDNYPYKEIRIRADELEREYIRENGVPVKDGLYNLLERLKKNNIFIALATSSRREIAEEYLISAKVYRYFDIIVCGDEVSKGKPNPEIFQKAAFELTCNPSECLIFEDSQNGLIAASSAGGIPIFIKDIKEPDAEVKALAYKSYEKMTDFLKDFIPFSSKLSVPYLNEYFPLNEENVVAGIHGFGAIGGGYLAPIFSHWDGYTRPAQIIGATRNPLVLNLVNSLGKYRIKYESQAYFQTVSNVTVIDTENEADMLDMYKRSAIIGLALPEQVIRLQAGIIAKGLYERYENGGDDLTIMIVMNKLNAAKFVRNHVRNSLKEITTTDKVKSIISRTCFIETVVNRMVSAMPEDFIITKLMNDLDHLNTNVINLPEHINIINEFFKYYKPKKKQASKKSGKTKNTSTAPAPVSIYDSLASFSALSNAVSEINVTLFSSEPDMPLYALKGSNIVDNLRQVITVDDINSMQEIKNKLSNGPHAIIAWYSMLLGYDTIGQGMGDERIVTLAENIIKKEIKPALVIENPDKVKYINSFIKNFIVRCRNSFKDSCTRVGRDCLRKLQNDQRVIGTIKMAQKYEIDTEGLEFGAACAILYCVLEKSPSDAEGKRIKAIYEENFQIADVLAYDGEYNKEKYKGLDRVADKELINRIEEKFNKLKAELTD